MGKLGMHDLATSTMDGNEDPTFRPIYPSSLENLIMTYQRAHSNSFRLAHHVGSGLDSYAHVLAEYFQHVHVSDTDCLLIAHERRRLDSWFGQNWWKGRFTFSGTTAEQSNINFADGSVDLVLLMQSASRTDQDAMVQAAAASLTSNGTLAIVQYNQFPRVVGNDSVNEAVKQVYTLAGEVVAKRGDLVPVEKRNLLQGNAGLECVYLPDDLFIQDVTKRIAINVRGNASAPFAFPGQDHLIAISRVDPQHRRYDYTNEDLEGKGWRLDVSGSWFRGIGDTLDKNELPAFETHFQNIEKIIHDTTPTNKVTVEWTVAVLFATRK